MAVGSKAVVHLRSMMTDGQIAELARRLAGVIEDGYGEVTLNIK